MKECNKCKIEKDLSEFAKGRKTCKTCISQYNLEYRQKTKGYNSHYYQINKKDIQARCKDWRNNNQVAIKEYQKKYYIKNKDRIDIRNKEWEINNKEKRVEYRIRTTDHHKEWAKNYRQVNKEQINIQKRTYTKNRLKTDSLFLCKTRIRSIMSNVFTRNGYSKKSRTQEILGCSFEEFKIYLESKFEHWMNWDNYGLYNGELNYGWDMDHILPTMLAKTEEDLVKLNHYTNMQPLCSKINRDIKKDSVTWYKSSEIALEYQVFLPADETQSVS